MCSGDWSEGLRLHSFTRQFFLLCRHAPLPWFLLVISPRLPGAFTISPITISTNFPHVPRGRGHAGYLAEQMKKRPARERRPGVSKDGSATCSRPMREASAVIMRLVESRRKKRPDRGAAAGREFSSMRVCPPAGGRRAGALESGLVARALGVQLEAKPEPGRALERA
jgi:hypothetical protein